MMKIGVSGANGNIGRAVVAGLQVGTRGAEIIAISRTPDMQAGAVQGRLGDYDNPETLASAYAGLDRLLLIPGADLRPGVRSRQAVAMVDAAVAAGVGHIFLLSATGTREEAEPAIGAAYWAGEHRLVRSAAKRWTILRMSFFAETFLQMSQPAMQMGTMFGLADTRMSLVARADIAAGLTGALAGENQVGAIYNLTGPAALSGAERAAALADAAGKTMPFEVVSEDRLRAMLAQGGLPPPIADMMIGMLAHQASGVYDIVTGDVEMLSGRAPKPFRDVLASGAA